MTSGEFAYIPIGEGRPFRNGMGYYYNEFIPAAAYFGTKLPEALLGNPTHLDPDFDRLTYGDQGQRGKRIKERLGTAPRQSERVDRWHRAGPAVLGMVIPLGEPAHQWPLKHYHTRPG
jgi:hypothetical protein